MADTKISALTAASAAAAANEFAINEAGTSKKLTMAQIATFLYPVGSIYISTASTNPATLFGFGTWSAFGAGRVIVGLNSGDTDFDVSEETGGAKTVTLTSAEMPAHGHTQDTHNHTQDAHSHTENAPSSASGGTDKFGIDTNASGIVASNQLTSSNVATNQAATATNQNTGGGGAHANVQPYIVCYMFKRTA